MLYNIDKQQDVILITIEGAFTFNDSDAFVQIVRCLEPANDSSCHAICFDIERLEKIDSTAVGLLLELLDTARRNHRNFVVAHAKGEVRKKLKAAAQYNRGLVIQ